MSKLEMGKTYRSLFAGNTGSVRFTPLFIGKQISILSRSDSGTEQIYDHDCSWLVEYVSPPPPPVKIVQYFNVYDRGLTYSYRTRGDADFAAGEGRKACLRVEYEKGQFDE